MKSARWLVPLIILATALCCLVSTDAQDRENQDAVALALEPLANEAKYSSISDAMLDEL